MMRKKYFIARHNGDSSVKTSKAERGSFGEKSRTTSMARHTDCAYNFPENLLFCIINAMAALSGDPSSLSPHHLDLMAVVGTNCLCFRGCLRTVITCIMQIAIKIHNLIGIECEKWSFEFLLSRLFFSFSRCRCCGISACVLLFEFFIYQASRQFLNDLLLSWMWLEWRLDSKLETNAKLFNRFLQHFFQRFSLIGKVFSCVQRVA